MLVSTNCLSTDNAEQDKRLESVTNKPTLNETTQFGIFIQCNGPVSCNIYSTNETVSANNKYDSSGSSKNNLDRFSIPVTNITGH